MAEAAVKKLDFAGAEWVDAARGILEDIVAQHGEAGKAYSVSEAFTDAPSHVAPSGLAAWHFHIDGKSVRVGVGEDKNADIRIRADYQSSLPGARLVYTPEIIAERQNQPPPDESAGSVEGDMSALPPYLVELHNRLAVLTA